MPPNVEGLQYIINRAEISHIVTNLFNTIERSQQNANAQMVNESALKNAQAVSDKDKIEEVKDRRSAGKQKRSYAKKRALTKENSDQTEDKVVRETNKGVRIDIKA